MENKKDEVLDDVAGGDDTVAPIITDAVEGGEEAPDLGGALDASLLENVEGGDDASTTINHH